MLRNGEARDMQAILKTNALLTLVLCGAAILDAQSKPVQTVYVNELVFRNNPELGGFVRSKLISSLAEYCGSVCTVKEAVDGDGDVADTVLNGSVLVQQMEESRRYKVQGAMRLMDKDGAILWAATIYSSPFARSATSSFADNVAKKLALFLTGKKGTSAARQ